MTSPTAIHPLHDERRAGLAAVALAAAALAFANFGGAESENGGAVEYAIGLALCAVVAAILFGRVLPRVERPGRAAWWLAAGAVVTLAVFWSGLPIILGAAAIAVALRAGTIPPAVVAGLAVAAACAACVAG